MSSISMSVRVIAGTLIVLAGVLLVFAFSTTAFAQTAPTCTINANPSSVSYSGTSYNPVVLTWNSSNATSANLTNVGSVSTSGSQTFYPSATITYVLNVYNAQGQSGQCQTTVTVTNTSSAPSCWITLSNYNSGAYNQPATLSWGSTNATSANISPNIGSIGTSGSQTVYPSVNQIYTMTVYNSQGQSATCQTSQYYQPGYGNLSCSIYANPSNVQSGQTTYLTWNSTGANTAWLSDSLGNVATNGSLAVRPAASRTYTLTISDSQGRTQTCNAYVTVSGSTYPYVGLNQIPYTGFDLGPVGNILYWATLALFALAAGYLVVYFLPRLVFGNVGPSRSSKTPLRRSILTTHAVAVPEIFQRGTIIRTASASLADLPVARSRKGSASAKDSMSFEDLKNGAPRIIINRE